MEDLGGDCNLEGHVEESVHVPVQARYVHKVSYCIDTGIKTPAICRVASVPAYRLKSFSVGGKIGVPFFFGGGRRSLFVGGVGTHFFFNN